MRYVTAVVFPFVILTGSAASAQISVTAGGGASTGEYGSSRSTTMSDAMLGVRWSRGGTSVSATLPYVAIDSPGVVFSGFDGTPLVMAADLGGPRTSRDGVGDPTVSVAHDFPVGGFTLRGTGRIKIPVQGYNRISTGRFDFSVGGEVSRRLGAVTPFVDLSYRSFGNPDGWTVRDGFAGSVGAAVPVGGGSVAVSYNVARSTSDYIDDAQEIVAAYDAPIAKSRLRASAFGTVGLSDGAPGFGAGLRLVASF